MRLGLDFNRLLTHRLLRILETVSTFRVTHFSKHILYKANNTYNSLECAWHGCRWTTNDAVHAPIVLLRDCKSQLYTWVFHCAVVGLCPGHSACYMHSVTSSSSDTFFTSIIRLNALNRFHNCTYTLHCTYMNTSPPVKPIATTTSLVQKGQSK